MLFKECFKIHIIEYRANQGNVFPKKSSYCKDHAIQGFVNQGPTVTPQNPQNLKTQISEHSSRMPCLPFRFFSYKMQLIVKRQIDKSKYNQ